MSEELRTKDALSMGVAYAVLWHEMKIVCLRGACKIAVLIFAWMVLL